MQSTPKTGSTTPLASAEISPGKPEDRSGAVCVRLVGDWLMASDRPGAAEVLDRLGSVPAQPHWTFDASSLGRWDSSLVTFLFVITAVRRGLDPRSAKGCPRVSSVCLPWPRRFLPGPTPTVGDRVHRSWNASGAAAWNCSVQGSTSWISSAMSPCRVFASSWAGRVSGDATSGSCCRSAGAEALPIVSLSAFWSG